ncbi:streptolysin associated protein SagB [Longispora fulva]|uniref:SagB-type dehydrogenase family enzyme n=1 Tax=Longispora fulva TaxID=619741 RepID=A0A8J7G7U7_9ACTN|nr:SagB family peptide dehydrogenase [Longispora fulva]MBG6135318.1 SagB-type dehydrogenase family enzyme [Longispora fulva]GIG56443.1 streptolysin associated protein SagB [Longispora fulva]
MPYRRSKEEVEAAAGEVDYLRTVGSFAMQHTIVSIYSPSTVVKTPETTIRGRWATPGEDFSGEQLLLNYRPDNARISFQLGIGRFFEPDAVLTACHAELEEDLRAVATLPKPKRIRTGLSAVVDNRRSTRDFGKDPVSLADLATVLHHAQGMTGELPYGNPNDPHGVIRLRTVPSGGGLYPVTLFVQAFHVDGLADGAYEYLPHAHALGVVEFDGDPASVLRSVDFDVAGSGFVLTYVYNLLHNSRKYGDAGVVFGLIEVGGISQTVHLTRTALALAGVDQGGYDKQGIERALGLDGLSRHVVHMTVIGQEG